MAVTGGTKISSGMTGGGIDGLLLTTFSSYTDNRSGWFGCWDDNHDKDGRGKSIALLASIYSPLDG